LAGLLAGPLCFKDAIHDDATENGLVVQVRGLRTLPRDLPELAEPAQLIKPY
jgi:hypothetical protein